MRLFFPILFSPSTTNVICCNIRWKDEYLHIEAMCTVADWAQVKIIVVGNTRCWEQRAQQVTAAIIDYRFTPAWSHERQMGGSSSCYITFNNLRIPPFVLISCSTPLFCMSHVIFSERYYYKIKRKEAKNWWKYFARCWDRWNDRRSTDDRDNDKHAKRDAQFLLVRSFVGGTCRHVDAKLRLVQWAYSLHKLKIPFRQLDLGLVGNRTRAVVSQDWQSTLVFFSEELDVMRNLLCCSGWQIEYSLEPERRSEIAIAQVPLNFSICN